MLAREGMTRRRFLQGTLAGGAAGLTMAAGGSLVGWKTGRAVGRTAAELEAAAETLKLKGLLVLYENLERIEWRLAYRPNAPSRQLPAHVCRAERPYKAVTSDLPRGPD